MENEELIRFPNLERVLNEYGQALQDEYKLRLLKDGKTASYNLVDTVRYIYSTNGRKYEISLNLASYWRFVEYGRKPGKYPPPDKILEWVRIKPLLPRPMKNGKLPTEKQLAFLIGRKIAEEGIDAGNQLQDSVEAINHTYMLKIYDAIDKDIDGIAVTIFNNFSNPKWN